MNTPKTLYSDEELLYFKGIIEQKLEEAKKSLESLKKSYSNVSDQGTNDTSPVFKAYEEGQEVLSKESNASLALRQEKFIRKLEYALLRIKNKTYGICRITGELIDKKRLELVPHATLSVKGKKMQ